MTARPISAERYRRPASAAVALALLLAMAMAAGCVSQPRDNREMTLSQEKYVLLVHKIDMNFVPISGSCFRIPGDRLANPLTFDENTGNLSGITYTYNPETDYNEPLLLVYFQGITTSYGLPNKTNDGDLVQGNGLSVYSLPKKFTANSHDGIIESVSGDGSVSLSYQGESIVLKPKERRVNVTQKKIYGENIRIERDNPLKPSECSEDFITTDTLYNAGVYDKKVR